MILYRLRVDSHNNLCHERCSSLLTLDNVKAGFALCSLSRSLVLNTEGNADWQGVENPDEMISNAPTAFFTGGWGVKAERRGRRSRTSSDAGDKRILLFFINHFMFNNLKF